MVDVDGAIVEGLQVVAKGPAGKKVTKVSAGGSFELGGLGVGGDVQGDDGEGGAERAERGGGSVREGGERGDGDRGRRLVHSTRCGAGCVVCVRGEGAAALCLLRSWFGFDVFVVRG